MKFVVPFSQMLDLLMSKTGVCKYLSYLSTRNVLIIMFLQETKGISNLKVQVVEGIASVEVSIDAKNVYHHFFF